MSYMSRKDDAQRESSSCALKVWNWSAWEITTIKDARRQRFSHVLHTICAGSCCLFIYDL